MAITFRFQFLLIADACDWPATEPASHQSGLMSTGRVVALRPISRRTALHSTRTFIICIHICTRARKLGQRHELTQKRAHVHSEHTTIEREHKRVKEREGIEPLAVIRFSLFFFAKQRKARATLRRQTVVELCQGPRSALVRIREQKVKKVTA